jgi:hypothetical protein
VATSWLWAAAILALTLVACLQGDAHRMRAWPDWRQLGGGGAGSGGGGNWFAQAVELLAVVPVLLVVTTHHMALHPVVRLCG